MGGRKNTTTFYLGISMILIGVLLWLFKIYPLGGGLIIGGTLLLISNIYYTRKPETETIIDERIERINDKAGHYAFWITVLSLSIIFWIDLCGILKVNLIEIYEIPLLIGIYSWLLLRFHFSRKGFR
ncbi:MAG TPA: hypothetical protein ENI32_04775 [Candidatus Syntrophoarchaeum butanivorans]|uniref:DUF2178 domain-containing protein n=1 Tax=Candidatus Syntropharchaeum butanivorans TaxID=1839936 RepID=A0A7J2S3N3_9EURY|nr:hypothetical protein [Candidatus Syntrophoarchaeum butanivorans]